MITRVIPSRLSSSVKPSAVDCTVALMITRVIPSRLSSSVKPSAVDCTVALMITRVIPSHLSSSVKPSAVDCTVALMITRVIPSRLSSSVKPSAVDCTVALMITDTERFQDPITYIESMRDDAESCGMCMIVPPEGWQVNRKRYSGILSFTLCRAASYNLVLIMFIL